jgi:hypothetical protein
MQVVYEQQAIDFLSGAPDTYELQFLTRKREEFLGD